LDYQLALSSDGAKLVFVRNGVDASFHIATMDLASGRVAELTSTEGPVGWPRWSPDGQQIVFTVSGEKDNGGPEAPKLGAAVVVDADGQNLHQVSPTTLNVDGAAWSPDGARLLLTASAGESSDIYTMRPDGTDLRQLTADGISIGASWTPGGRILFGRRSSGAADGGLAALWTMDADASNAVQLAVQSVAQASVDGWGRRPAWQPIGGPAIVPPPWHATPATPVGPPEATPPATPLPSLSLGFSWTGSLTVASGGVQATRLVDGRVLVVHACTSTAELYDPATGTFSPTGDMTARHGQTSTLLTDGRVLVTGGATCDDSGGVWTTAELFDPATGTFSPAGSMGSPRQGHTATLLPDGRVLVAGGTTGASAAASLGVTLASVRRVATEPQVLRTAELYDPTTGTFSPTGSMATVRVNHTATALLDGRVLVAGAGDQGLAGEASAELYDPATGTFHATGSMKTGRYQHTSTLLQDGRVLITGGLDPDTLTFASAEIYDPGAGTFSSGGSMHAARQGHTATRLPDGQVLIAGGYENDGQGWQVLSAVELFDPRAGVFTVVGSMGDARVDHAAVLLLDGRVLIAGGTYFGNSAAVNLTSAVLYQP
jgi:WD40 repeat protein